MFLLRELQEIFIMAAGMVWQMFWAVVLGLLLSAIVQALVSPHKVAGALGRNSASGSALAAVLGAASSSCSYAATALARSLFSKGATLSNAIVFEFGSTNLVFDLGFVLLALLGWQFVAAQYLGGVIMIAVMSVIFKLTLSRRLEDKARTQALLAVRGKMEGHAGMDMSVPAGPFLERVFSAQAFTGVSHYFYMDFLSILPDLIMGIIIASVLATVLTTDLWQRFLAPGNPVVAIVWGPLIGPLISMVSFVCSIGNVPMAAVLWRGGMSFGGVISFIFADLLILPIFNIYRKYYGLKTAVYLFAVSYLSIVVAGIAVELMFNALDVMPPRYTYADAQDACPHSVLAGTLNITALAIAAILGIRFIATGGPQMMKHMNAQAMDEVFTR